MVLVTLGHDFGNILRFPPDDTAGIVVLENPVPASHDFLLKIAQDAARKLKEHPVEGKRWIVEPGRIRERPAWSESAGD
jgi:hypothetical protein